MGNTTVKCEKTSCQHNYYGNCRDKSIRSKNQELHIESKTKCDNYKNVPEKCGIKREGEI